MAKGVEAPRHKPVIPQTSHFVSLSAPIKRSPPVAKIGFISNDSEQTLGPASSKLYRAYNDVVDPWFVDSVEPIKSFFAHQAFCQSPQLKPIAND